MRWRLRDAAARSRRKCGNFWEFPSLVSSFCCIFFSFTLHSWFYLKHGAARSTRFSGGLVAEVLEGLAKDRVCRSNRYSGYQWSNCGGSFEHRKWRSPEAVIDIIFSKVVYIVIQHSRYCH